MRWLSTRAMAILAVAVWGIFLAVLGFQKLERDRPAREAARAASESAAREAAVIAEAETLVRDRLSDPQSAQFTEVRVLGGGIDQRVCGLVNGKNKFGGYHGPERFLVIMGSAYIGDERPGPIIWSKPQHPCTAS